MALDPDGERFRITLDDRVIDSSCVETDSLGHATALEFEKVLGEERYNSLVSFGFIRHPIEKSVSAYFFARKGTYRSVFGIKSAKSRWRLISKRLVTLSLAKLLPFSIWALIFPMKRCSDYFLDGSGRIMVNYLGATNRLGADLQSILDSCCLDSIDQSVEHLNRSSHKKAEKYVADGGLIFRYLSKRYEDDIKLYSLVEKSSLQIVGRQRIESLTEDSHVSILKV